MAHYAIIAGELAPGSRVSNEQFSKIPDLIRASFQAVNNMVSYESKLTYEIIRMDEFLGLSASPFHALRSVIMLFSAFRFLTYKELKERLDLKICIGNGPVEYAQDHLRESDGTAFRTATDGKEEMKRAQRLKIITPQKEVNGELELTCSFMDILIHDWSDEQAEAMFLNLTGKNQMEISKMLGISQPAVNRRLKAAHFDTIHKFINRVEKLMANKQS